MKNADELLKRILLNMKYDPKMSLNENRNVILSEQSINVGGYYVSYDNEYNRVKIESPSDNTYYWDPSGKWYKSTYYLGNEDNTDLDPTKDSKVISVLSNVFKKSGIGSNFYIKNKEQGDKFRQWIIKKDPSFATSIDLSKSGPFNNEYINKAWAKYGNQYKEQIKVNKPISSDDKQTQSVVADLKSKGFDASGAMSMNHAYALAAVRATKKLTDKISANMGGSTFTLHSVCVKKVGSTCAPGTYLTVDSFNLDMVNKINKLKDSSSEGWKPQQYVFLQNFYFDWGKIMNDLNTTFKSDKNSYSSELFPDGWWNWFTTYWGMGPGGFTSGGNLNDIKTHPEPQNVKVTDKNKYEKGYTMWSTEFLHDAASFVEMGTLILGLIPSPLSPILLGISTGAGLADAGVYFAEGDKYMGSMMLALEIIPGGEFYKVFKGSKTATKLGREGTMELLENGAKKTLKGSDEIAFQQLKQELKVVAPELAKGVQKQIVKNVTENLVQNFIKVVKGMSPLNMLKTFFNVLGIIWKSSGTIPQLTIKLGGTVWGVDQLYLAAFGRDEDRQNSDIRKLYYMIKGEGLPEEEELVKVLAEAQKYTDPEKLGTVTSEIVKQGKIDEYIKNHILSSYNKNVKNKKPGYSGSGKEITIPTPTIDEVISGNKIIYYGMSGEEILKIKKYLKTNYGSYLDPKIEKTINNPNFDDDFYDVLKDFQGNVLPTNFEIKPKEYGYIGNETYSLIIKSPIGKLKTKTIKDITYDELEKTKDKFNFYIWSLRTNKWVSSSFDEFRNASKEGVKVTYSPKVNLEVNNQLASKDINQNKQKGFRFRSPK